MVVALRKTVLNDLYRLLAIVGELSHLLAWIETEDHHETFDHSPVKFFLVDNQNFADVKCLFGHFSLDELQNVG